LSLTDFSDTIASLSLMERPNSIYRVDMVVETGSVDNEASSVDGCDSDSGYNSWRHAIQADCCCLSVSTGAPATAAATCWYHHHYGPHNIDDIVMSQSGVHPKPVPMTSSMASGLGYDEFNGGLIAAPSSVNFDPRCYGNPLISVIRRPDDVIKSFDSGAARISNGVQRHDRMLSNSSGVSDVGGGIAAGFGQSATAMPNDLQTRFTGRKSC
jgi:hypothetical protein